MPDQFVQTDASAIDHFLQHAVERVYPSFEEFRLKLLSGRRLTAYHGIDPTGVTLHIGHAIPIRKLAEFQRLGHRVVLLIGDFTAMIGDPTDKTAARRQLTHQEVLDNCRLYQRQLSKFLAFDGPNPAELRFNSEWLAKMSFVDVIELAAHFTVQQMLERDMFDKRLAEQKPIYVHEFFYPLMQGYDSVALDTDLEIGGNDQTFNMLAGRTLLREMKGKDKAVMTMKLLTDPSGKKMGKTEGNMVSLIDAPEDMYGKVMSWTDGMILPGFELCTTSSSSEIAAIRSALEAGENPMAYKRQLAQRIVTEMLDATAANQAAEHFQRVHQRHEQPEEIPIVTIKSAQAAIVELLVLGKLVDSRTEAKRQIDQKAVSVEGQLVEDVDQLFEIPPQGLVIQKGKRHFVRLVLAP